MCSSQPTWRLESPEGSQRGTRGWGDRKRLPLVTQALQERALTCRLWLSVPTCLPQAQWPQPPAEVTWEKSHTELCQVSRVGLWLLWAQEE